VSDNPTKYIPDAEDVLGALQDTLSSFQEIAAAVERQTEAIYRLQEQIARSFPPSKTPNAEVSK
jgi:hypothetical protein